MVRSALAPVLLALMPALAAQQPAPDRVGERARDMREQIETGAPSTAHVRVSMRLKNGNKLTGVVKDGRLVERVDGMRFVDASAAERGAGVRLWYCTGGRDFVFVQFGDLAEYTILQKLTAKQIEEIERDLQVASERRVAEEAARERARQRTEVPPTGEAGIEESTPPAPGQEPAPPAPPVSPKDGSKPKDSPASDKADPSAKAQQQEWFALLQEYPVAAGWGKEKRDEIARRFVVIGSKPSEKEQRFVDQFAQWQKACEFFDVKPPAKGEGESPDGRARGSRRR